MKIISLTSSENLHVKAPHHLTGMDSGHIQGLLNKKHEGDVIVPSCKNGETWGARDLSILDAWVLRRTYSPLTTIGYEIKVSRQDFERDQKWTAYLDLCHYFYFACPAGLIRANDVPQRVGIIWASKDKLHTVKKSERVEPDMVKLQRLLIYVLMGRATIVNNSSFSMTLSENGGHLDRLRGIVEKAKERGELAYFVRGHIREYTEKIVNLDRGLAHREEIVKRFEDKLKVLGITWDSTTSNWQDDMRVENEIDMVKKSIDIGTLEKMERLGNDLTLMCETIKSMRENTRNAAKAFR